MDPEIKIIQLDEPDWDVVSGGINSFKMQQAGDGHTMSCAAGLRQPMAAMWVG